MLAALTCVVVLLREVLLPFVAGAALAYLLDPLATWLERLGLNRLIATLALVFSFLAGFIILFALTGPIIVSELVYFVDNFPLYIKQMQGLATDPSRPWLSKIVGEGLGYAESSISDLMKLTNNWLGEVLRSAWSGGQELISVLSLAIVTPIVTCYLVYDWRKIKAVIDNWVPPAQRDTVRALAAEIDQKVGGFVLGNGALCLIMAAFYATALSILGLNHGVLIGAAAGLIGFIPYLGSLTGLVVSTCVAIAQFWPDWTLILAVPAIFLVGQTIADYLLSPVLVGRRVDLNPVWVMFALFGFGNLFGFVGLLIAVPLAAAIGVIVRFALKQYYASSFYIAKPVAADPQTSASGRPDDGSM
ncbi:pheromone autoinducer 2 transporter [Blastochloris viridis]|nr:pheromone autoinducer 2 transporter [Blastochloris viridis]